MKKHKKKIIYLILFSAILLFCNNTLNIFSFIIKRTEFSINIINGTFLLSLFIYFLSLLQIEKNKNTHFFIFSFIIVLLNIINGLFNINVFAFLILYLFLMLSTLVVMNLTKQKFEISLILSTSILLIINFILAILNILFIAKYLLFTILLFNLFYFYKTRKKIKVEILFEQLFSYSTLIFTLMFIIALLTGVGRYIHTWDEFSYWAYDAKAVIHFSKLSANQEILSSLRSYPPILTIWQYFVSTFTGFSENNIYIALNLLCFIYLMPVLIYITNKTKKILPILFIAAYGFSILYDGAFSYTIYYADLVMAIVFSSLLIIYNYLKTSKIKTITISTILIILTLMKPSGFVLSFTFLFLVFCLEYNNKHSNYIKSFFENIKIFILKWWKVILSIISFLVIWYCYLYIMQKQTIEFYDFILLPDILKSDITYKLNVDFLITIMSRLFEILDTPMFFGIVNLTLYQYIILMFASIFIVFYMYFENIKQTIRKFLPYLFSYIVFFGLTFLSLFVMFSVYEAEKLASFTRYLNAFHCSISIFLLAFLSQYKIVKNKKKLAIVISVYLILILNVPFSKMFSSITDIKGRISTIEFNEKMNNRFQIINDNTPDNSLIYIIDQKDESGIMSVWYSRYYLFPRRVNADPKAITWKIKTEINYDDLGEWGLTAKTWEQNLIEYNFDYVYLYSYDEKFLKEINYMIVNNNYDEPTLFKIIKNDNKVILEPIL